MNELDKKAQSQPNIPEKFLKPYDPTNTETRIYKLWEESGYFNPDKLPTDKPGRGAHGEPFSIVLPPPNVTGTLHMGHAAMLAIEDIMVRYKRMQGFKTLWLPGTDHAAIATQSKVEKEIEKKEGKRRHDLGREELLKRIDIFAKESHDTIINQVRKMGASIDWSREAFTLDEKRTVAVRTAFKKMYDLGLIYRGSKVINWDPKGQTTISDDEIVYETRKAKLYTFKYGKDINSGELIPITISTTRPETKLGDTAIAVHPDDVRYKDYIGKEYDAVFAGDPIHLKVIADSAVEPEFGTGALGVTPAHSSIDWDMAQRHDLPLKQVIDEFAKMTVGFDEKSAPKENLIIKGKKVGEARTAVVEWLKSENLLEKEEDIEQNVATAERTGAIIEPLPKLQWFISVDKRFKIQDSKIPGIASGSETTLKEIMMKSVKNDEANPQGKIEIIPERFERVYFNWINNLRDWCISRQIWYGHRIPVWYRKGKTVNSKQKSEGTETYVGINAPEGEGWEQDSDTLDTWFSSGLWTFSTLGWPEETVDIKTFHPTSVLETGYDILFFWVARMILMTGCLLGDVPFKTVYLHGLVRDGKGKKMSKSLGNIIDPLDMIEKYGADATRLSLIIGTGPGNDTKLSEDKVKGYKNFGNKLWNITRFILSAAAGERFGKESVEPIGFVKGHYDYRINIVNQSELTKVTSALERSYLEKLNNLLAEITKEMDEYKFYLVGEKLYHYTWNEFADKILEESKSILNGDDMEARASRVQYLLYTLETILKALHPFMPYVTEEIWQEVNKGKSILMIEEWSKV